MPDPCLGDNSISRQNIAKGVDESRSLTIFMSFVRMDETGKCSSQSILSKDCFLKWKSTRTKEVKDPETAFRRVLTSHIRGTDGRQPFPESVERLLLHELRAKDSRKLWFSIVGTTKVGRKRFKHLGFHEMKRKEEKYIQASKRVSRSSNQHQIENYVSPRTNMPVMGPFSAPKSLGGERGNLGNVGVNGLSLNEGLPEEVFMLFTVLRGISLGIKDIAGQYRHRKGDIINLLSGLVSVQPPLVVFKYLEGEDKLMNFLKGLIDTFFESKGSPKSMLPASNPWSAILNSLETNPRPVSFAKHSFLHNDFRWSADFIIPPVSQCKFSPGTPVGSIIVNKRLDAILYADEVAEGFFERPMQGVRIWETLASPLHHVFLVIVFKLKRVHTFPSFWHRFVGTLGNGRTAVFLHHVQAMPHVDSAPGDPILYVRTQRQDTDVSHLPPFLL